MDIQALLSPVSEDAPGGADSRYEPEYITMLEEIEKLNSVSQPQECRWDVVEEQAMLILQHRAKDFQAASYLAYASCRLHGLEGIADGAALLAGLITTYWETGFPVLRRVRGRINAVSWWQERVETALDSLGSDPDARFDQELLARLDKALTDLDSAIAMRMPDLPSMRPLIDRARRLLPLKSPEPAAAQEALAAAVPQSPVSPVSQPAEVTTQPAPRLTAPAPVRDNAEQNRRDFLRYAADFAEAALTEDPLSPLAWQALCLARLGMIETLPPAEGGSTRLPPPEQSERAALEQLTASGMHAEALTALCNSWGNHLFWLDSLRMLARSLQALHSPAADVLALETLAFVRRLPGVELAAFSDGSPFADADTRAWLNAICAESTSSPPPDAAASLTARARTLFAQNRQAEALDLLDTGLAAADSHTWLVLRCEQVHLLVRSEAYVPALALAEDLLDRADALHTESWDRELLLDILRVTDSCLAKASAAQPDEAGHAARRNEICQRIALLRPAAALHGL